MAGWVTKPLGEVIFRGETVDPTKSPHKDFLYVDVSCVSKETLTIQEPTRLKGAEAPSRARRSIKNGDVIFATIRPTLQRIAVVPPSLDDQVCSTGYFVFRTKPYLSNRFLFYFLQTSHFTDAMERLQAGASYPAVNDKQVSDQEISFPPLAEQNRIVATLDEAFESIATAITNTERALAGVREVLDSSVENVLAHCGSGGRWLTVADICDLISGQHIDAADYTNAGNGIGYLTGPSDFGDVHPIVTKWTEVPKRNALKGDILITVKGSGVGKVNWLDIDEVAISRQLMAVRARGIDAAYVYAVLRTKFAYFQSLATGAAIPGISRVDVLKLPMLVPSPAEQRRVILKIDKLTELVGDGACP